MKAILIIAIMLLIPGSLSAQSFDTIYEARDLSYWQTRYPENIRYNFDEVLFKALTATEKQQVEPVRLQFPLVFGENPLGFYSSPSDRVIVMPIMGVKFLDDLAIASAWLERQGFSQETVYFYLGMLKYRKPKEFPEGKYPTPLKALHIPADALQDKWVDDVSQKILKSAVIFILGHELGHIYYQHNPLPVAQRQQNERQADAFACNLFGRIGVPPMGMTHYFLAATYLSNNPGDFPTKEAWQQFLAKTTHPFTAARLHSLASFMRANAQDFVKYEAHRKDAIKRIYYVADQIDGISRIQEDTEFQRIFSRFCSTLEVNVLRPRRPGESLIPLVQPSR